MRQLRATLGQEWSISHRYIRNDKVLVHDTTKVVSACFESGLVNAEDRTALDDSVGAAASLPIAYLEFVFGRYATH